MVDQAPDLQFSLPAPVSKPLNEPFDLPLTPASTPNAAGNSPEVVATPGASGFEQEADSKLIDVREDTWMFVSSEVLQGDPRMPSLFCQPIAEGFLLKRAGATDEDGVYSLGVGLVHSSEIDQTNLLKETLQMFHKLSVLARMRRITDPLSGMLPIHLAAALKGCSTLISAMAWENAEEG